MIAIIAQCVSASAALVGAFFAIREYRRQGRIRRFDAFLRLKAQVDELARKYNLLTLLETDDPALRSISLQDRADILGLFESISIAVTSGLVSERQAFYFFGYYALGIRESKNFLHDINGIAIYWAEFIRFAARMEKAQADFVAETEKGKLKKIKV